MTCDLSGLGQFYGTKHYYWEHYYWYGGIGKYYFTDGVKYVADQCGAYWLIDEIMSYQLFPRTRKMDFQVWKLTVDTEKKEGVLSLEDGDGHEILRKKLDYTDFGAPAIEMWMENNVLYIPTER